MTDLSATDLALPAALASQPRLDGNDWEVQSWFATQEDMYGRSHWLLCATLVPRNGRAIGQLSSLPGQCFLAGNHLWCINEGNLQLNPGGMAIVEISCHSIWQSPGDSLLLMAEGCPITLPSSRSDHP